MSRVTVRNPWFRKDGPYSRPMYELEGKPVFEYRGVSVYKRSMGWLYVLGDTAITERAGFRKEAAPAADLGRAATAGAVTAEDAIHAGEELKRA